MLLRKAMLLRKLAAGLLLALLAGALLGWQPSPNCAPDAYIKGVMDANARGQQFIPQWTPDGELLVYAEGGKIYSAKPDGTDKRLISRSNGDYDLDSAPNISPDGSRIVYAAHRQSGFILREWRWDIATARIDGRKERILTKDTLYNRNPVWSPDGRHIAWMSWSSRVMVMESDGSQPRRLAPEVVAEWFPPRWSPDGQRIAFIGDEREKIDGTDEDYPDYSSPLYVASLDGQVLRVAEVLATPSATPPAWSPDGQRLAFVRLADPGRKALYTIAPDGSQPQEVMRLHSRLTPVENLAWSPDGSEILLHYRDGLAAVAQDGATLQKFSLDATDAAASWSPDGTRVAVFDKDGGGLSVSARRGPPVHFRPPELADRGYLGGQDPADCRNNPLNAPLEDECRALLRIGAALAAQPPLDWNPNRPMSEWEGIRVGAPSAVVALELGQRDLTGIILPELGQLAELEVLDLGGNWLAGEIPPELGRLTNLRGLDLAYNSLTGNIPGELGRLSRLQSLYLNNNYLNGVIPPELSKLTSLRSRSWSNNHLTRAPVQNQLE